MRVYRDRDQIILSDSSGANPNAFPASKVSITPIGNRVRVGIDNTYMYFPLGKFRDKNGNAYSTVSVDSAVTKYVKTLPDASDELATRLKYVTSSGLFSTATADVIQFDNASWERKTGSINSSTPGYGTMRFAGPTNTFYERKVDGYINVKWFGAKGDRTTDDFAAIMAACNYLYKSLVFSGIGASAGTIYMPRGIYSTSQRLVIPNRVRLLGDGARSTAIRPTTVFSDSVLVELSNRLQTEGPQNTFSNLIQSISLDLDNRPALIGLFSKEINEQSGARDFLIANVAYKGISVRNETVNPIVGIGPQNFYFSQGEIIFGTSETANTIGIEITINGATFQALRDITIFGRTSIGKGFVISNANGWMAHSIHVEGLDRGFSLSDYGQTYAFQISGVNSQNNVNATVYIRGTNDTYGFMISGLRNSPGRNAIQDFKNQVGAAQNIPGPIGFYTVSSNAPRTVLCSNPQYNRYAFQRTTVADANYTVALTDVMVVYTTLTAARNLTLPTAANMAGRDLLVKDESGNAGTNAISIVGTVDGVTNKTINTAYGSIRLYSNGIAWFTR